MAAASEKQVEALTRQMEQMQQMMAALQQGANPPTLSVEAVRELLRCGSFATTTLQAAEDPAVLAAIQRAVDVYNAGAASAAHQVGRFAVLPNDFSLRSGGIGPTLKLRRFAVSHLHASRIAEPVAW